MSGSISNKIVTDGLVLYLDAGNPRSYISGSTVWYDLEYGTPSGSLINGPTFSSENVGSIVFDGVDDYVQVQPITSLSSTSYTISSWFKPISFGGVDLGFATLIGSSSIRRILWNSGSKNILAQMGGNPSSVSSTLNSVPTSQWSYVTYIYDNNLNKEYLYINGVYNAIANNPSSAFNATFYLGLYGAVNSYLLNGNISMVKIYNKRLSDLENIQNYNATKSRFRL
jgi:hypothetical protein